MMGMIYAFGAWVFIALLLSKSWRSFKDGIQYLRKLHHIPCSQCVFHTNCAALKCTIHPHKALTEEAEFCPDFEPNCGILQ